MASRDPRPLEPALRKTRRLQARLGCLSAEPIRRPACAAALDEITHPWSRQLLLTSMTANQVPSVMREGVPSVISVPFVPPVPWAYLNTATTCCGGGGVRPSPGAATPTGGSASKQLCAHGGPEPAAPVPGRTPVAVSRCAPDQLARPATKSPCQRRLPAVGDDVRSL